MQLKLLNVPKVSLWFGFVGVWAVMVVHTPQSDHHRAVLQPHVLGGDHTVTPSKKRGEIKMKIHDFLLMYHEGFCCCFHVFNIFKNVDIFNQA